MAISMDETTFRIIETLSNEIGRGITINALTEKVGQNYGSAYYANIYNKLKQIEKENIVTLKKAGSIIWISLNFREYAILDRLTEMELKKKRTFLKDRIEMQILVRELEKKCRKLGFVKSISLIDPVRNSKLNRAEFLFLVHGKSELSTSERETKPLATIMKLLRSIHNMKIDYLIMTQAVFLNLLSSSEYNPAREMLASKIAAYNPQDFWNEIQTSSEEGRPVRVIEETSPPKMSEQDLVYNMTRFGYSEMGTKITRAKDFCLEHVVSAMITRGDARRIEAVPVLLAKNVVNYDLLVFLSEKFGFSDKLLGLVKVLAEIAPKKELENAVRIMEERKIEESPADKNSVAEKMRLYNAT